MTALNNTQIVNAIKLVSKTLANIPVVHDGLSTRDQLIVVNKDYNIEPKVEEEVTFFKGQAIQVEDKVTEAPAYRFYRTLDKMTVGEYVAKAMIRNKVYTEEVVARKIGNDSWLLINKSVFDYAPSTEYAFIKSIAKEVFDEKDCANRNLQVYMCGKSGKLLLVDFDGENYVAAGRDEACKVVWSKINLDDATLLFSGNQYDFFDVMKKHLG